MTEETAQAGRSRSPLVGLLIVAPLAEGRLVGEIVGMAGELAIVQPLDESEIRGPGLLLLRLGSVALPGGRCRLFRTREELAQAVPPPARRDAAQVLVALKK